MRFCDQCGSPIRDDALFCPICSRRVAPKVTVPAREYQAAAPQEAAENEGATPEPGEALELPEAPAAAPHYAPAGNKADLDRPLSTSEYFCTLVVFAIPVIGLIMMIVWGFSVGGSETRKRLARAYLLRTLLLLLLLAVFCLVVGLSLFTAYQQMSTYAYSWGGYGPELSPGSLLSLVRTLL